MVKIYWNFFQICPEKNSDHFSIWSERLKFGRKTADRRPLFQALRQHEKIIFISSSYRVMFFLLYGEKSKQANREHINPA